MVLALLLAGVVVLVSSLAARSGPALSESASTETPAGQVEEIDGTDLHKVTLTPQAAQRLGITTGRVGAAQVTGKQRWTIPYSALIYDPSGATWTFVNPQTLVFQRHSVTVETIRGQVVTLSAGPPVGTAVVTKGASELYGAELGVGK